MRKQKEIVINTGPIISLVAATNGLEVLKKLYSNVYVPYEVKDEIIKGSSSKFAAKEFEEANFLIIETVFQRISPFLKNVLDIGEAAVIQLALDKGIKTVCIDEKAGRRVAKLNNLFLTGSVGILIQAKKMGFISSINDALLNMKSRGIYLSAGVVDFALRETGEK